MSIIERVREKIGVRPKLQELNEAEHQWISDLLKVAEFFVTQYSPTDAEEPLSLTGLDRAFAAWMELREKESWDKQTERVMRSGIGVYPANKDGILAAITRFATERGAGEAPAFEAQPGKTKTSADLGLFLEEFLGD